jgi:SAM-dependent methyltransferase
MVFKNYAKYYNLLYTDKDYKGESEYICKLIHKYSKKVSDVLDVGCGTGKHASLIADNGFAVTGIDLSADMISIAKSKNYKNCEFHTANASNFSLHKTFDVITSLFHVISYQTTNKILEEVFLNIRKHLKNDGVFIFDFWYTPAVFTLKPEVRIKRLEDQEIKVTRLSEPVHHFNENVIDVNFELHIEDKTSGKFEIIKELHKMRYFTIPELNFILEKCGLQALHYEEWMTGNTPSAETWGVCCIAKTIN